MPPKRGRPPGRRNTPRTSSRVQGTPGASGLDGSRESLSPATPRAEARVRAELTPGPSRYSTSYGSPTGQASVRRVKVGSAIRSIGSALSDLQAADQEDIQARRARLAAEARSRGEPDPSTAPAQRRPAAEEHQSEQDEDEDFIEASGAMPPPPAPRRSQRSVAGPSSVANSQPLPRGYRAASTQPGSSRPVDSPASTASNAGRLGSEPLHSDALSQRSFVEENELYGSANVATPGWRRTSPHPVDVPRKSISPQPPAFHLRRSPRHQSDSRRQLPPPPRSIPGPQPQAQSPTQAGAPVPARTGAYKTTSASPTPSRPATRGEPQSHAPANLSDSIDDDDEEDPLHNPTPRGLRTDRGFSARSPSRSQTQPQSQFQPQAEPQSQPQVQLQSHAQSHAQSQSQKVLGNQRNDPTTGVREKDQHVPNNIQDGHSASNTPDHSGEGVTQVSGASADGAQSGTERLRQPRRPNPIEAARSGGLLLPRPDRPGLRPRVEGDPPVDPAIGSRIPGTSQQSVPDRNRSNSPIAIPAGGAGQSSHQSDFNASEGLGSSLPRDRGSPTAAPAIGSRNLATSGDLAVSRPRNPFKNASSVGSNGQASQQSGLGRLEQNGTVPGGDSRQAPHGDIGGQQTRPNPVESRGSIPGVARSEEAVAVPSGDNRQVPQIEDRRQQPMHNNDGPNRDAPAGADPDANENHGVLPRVLKYFRRFSHLRNWPPKLRKALELWGLLVLLCWAFLIMLNICLPTNGWEGIQVGRDYQYYGMSLENWRQNILQFIPWIVLHPFAALTGNLDYADFREQLSRLELKEHSSAIKLESIKAATDQMRRILPEFIKINVNEHKGDWSIDGNFWHALDEELTRGSFVWSLLTLTKSESGYYTISDSHWDAIRQRLQNEQLLVSDRPAPEGSPLALSGEVVTHVELSVSKTFRDWLAQNEKDVRRMTGKNEGIASAKYGELYGDVEKIVAERLRALGLQEGIVTRDTFIEKMEQEFDQRLPYIKKEMERLEEKIGEALRIAEDAKNSPEMPSGLSHPEVSKLIDESVRRAIADAQLEAIAKGSIKSQLNELNQHRNYFNALRGALIDPRLTSGTYDWRPEQVVNLEKSKKATWSIFKSEKHKQPVYRDGDKSSGLPLAPSIVLDKWEEDGECWCAAHGGSKNTLHAADLSIFTTEPVVPQHLVVEHIGRSATFDPEAMPKNIEVWIQPPPDKRARTLHDWSKRKWADTNYGPGAKLVQKGFLKVGEFRFDSGIGKGESQVFKLSDELLGMDAQTRQVLVRATSNYGAKDHTCFYRLRLFGEEGRRNNGDDRS